MFLKSRNRHAQIRMWLLADLIAVLVEWTVITWTRQACWKTFFGYARCTAGATYSRSRTDPCVQTSRLEGQ